MKDFMDKFKIKYVLLLYKLANFSLVCFRTLVFLRLKPPKKVKSILIFRVGNIGDIICALPALNIIRKNFPDAELTFLSSPGDRSLGGALELVDSIRAADKILIYSDKDIDDLKKIFTIFRILRKKKCELFIELPSNLAKLSHEYRNILFSRLIGCKYGMGFNINNINLFLQLQSEYIDFTLEEETLAKLLEKEGLTAGEFEYKFSISEKDRQIAREMLIKFDRETILVLSPNSKRNTNIYDLNKFAEIGRTLAGKHNFTPVIIGGKDDRERSAKLSGLIGGKAVSIAGQLNLSQTIEFLKYCRLMVAVDGGPVHMASVAGLPVVGIYSAREVNGKWYPFGKKNIVIRKEPACHTCLKLECEKTICLDMISVAEVVEAAEKVLSNTASKV